MTPDVQPRHEAGPGRNGHSDEDPEIHADVDEDGQLQFGTWNDVVEYDHRPHVAHIEPPEQQDGYLTPIRVLREHAQRKRVAKKGYVMWYLLDSTWPRPRMVRPEQKGGGLPELEVDGHRYLFPREAMLPSELEGAWVVVHRKGEADPVSLRRRQASEGPPIPADALNEYVTSKVSATPPSWLSNLNLDAGTILRLGIVAIIAYAVIMQLTGSGVV